jgi:hypothetical protein
MLPEAASAGGGSFADALRDPALPVPASLVAHHGGGVGQRFNVYRNNVTHALVEAYGQIFPSVKAQSGEARFNDAVRLCAAAHPPRSKLVFELGDAFAGFLDGFEPARRQMPWLADLARLERLWLDGWHAADAAPLESAALGAILARTPPENLGALVFSRHPAAGVVRSQYAIFDLFSDGRDGKVTDDPFRPQSVLVTRPHLTMQLRRLEPGMAAFFDALMNAGTLGEASAAAAATTPEFDLQAAFGLVLESDALKTFQPEMQP